MLHLRIHDLVGEHAWNWQLLDESGDVLAEQAVELTALELQKSRALDLYRGLWLIDTDPRWRPDSERRMLAGVGDFLTERILGPIAPALLERAPVTVRIAVPDQAAHILGFPLELACHAGRVLGRDGVTWCYAPEGEPVAATPAGQQLRVLGVFALPIDSSALGLARERRRLTQEMSSFGPAVHFRVLQYGVTRAALREAIEEPEGWDVIHISGHGNAGVLHLESAEGGRDTLDTADVLDHLRATASRTRLVVLSACESGAARAARHGSGTGKAAASVPALSLRGLGYEVARALDCAVMAMRYPVDDSFSVAFTWSMYRALVVGGRPLDDALRIAHAETAGSTKHAPLSIATPMLIGRTPGLRLPQVSIDRTTRAPRMFGVPVPAASFAGRTRVLADVAAAVSARGPGAALALIGMPGIGKTAILAEAVQMHVHGFDTVIWHRLTTTDGAPELHRSLSRAAPGGRDPVDAVRRTRTLVVLDDAHRGLDARGRWRSPDLAEVVDALATPGGRSRLLLASARPLPPATPAKQVLVPLLNRSESDLLVRELAELGHTDAEPGSIGTYWHVCRGHPGLTLRVCRGTAQQVNHRTKRLAAAWSVFTPSGSTPEHRPGRARPGTHVIRWAKAQLSTLPETTSLLFSFLCALEAPDRNAGSLDRIWPLVAAGRPASDTADLDALTTTGLAQRTPGGLVLIHPAVATVGRDARADVAAHTVRLMAHWWSQAHDIANVHHEGEEALGHFAASAVPYLMRKGAWEAASARAEEAINHDRSTAMAARLLPFVTEIVSATAGTALGRATRYVRATIVHHLKPAVAISELTRLLADARAADDVPVIAAATSFIATDLAKTNPARAHEWLQEATDQPIAGHLSPLAGILLRLKTAQLFQGSGDSDHATTTSAELLAELDALTQQGGDLSGANPHHLRIEILGLAVTAAEATDPAEGRRLRQRILDETLAAGAGELDIARAQFNLLAAEIRDGTFDGAVEDLLVAARAVFGGPGNEEELGNVLGQLAELQRDQGNLDEAVELTGQALRADYAAGAGLQAAHDHHLLATLHGLRSDADQAAVHLLANAVIHVRMSGGMFTFVQQPQVMKALFLVKFLLARRPPTLPGTFSALREQLAELLGLDLAALLADTRRTPIGIDPRTGRPAVSLSDTGDGGDSVTDVLTWSRFQPPLPTELLDPGGFPDHWTEIIGAVAESARHGGPVPVLDELRAANWKPLADALGAVATGDRTATFTGLDHIDAAVVHRTIALLEKPA
ncbi:CHAT domain-containing protein [Amycolatopsis tolypomycina]|uniref:CHAT domain-containing protein n=1 Tax=Amycolatopsis tolypomycina TaxID=208445 RepID=UPI0033A35730